MIVACHQPNFIPWPGYFYKALNADIFVLLDNVQFPRGSSWVNRNRIKTATGQLWLTVPVWKKGRGPQRIKDVEIYDERGWGRKHYLSLVHAYANAPYIDDYLDFFRDVFTRTWKRLADLNMEILGYLKEQLRIETEFRLASELGVEAQGTELLVQVCKRLDATDYISSSCARKYLDERRFEEKGIGLKYYNFKPPIYPQLWGEFIPNLSTVDLLFNCGKKSFDIISRL